MIRKNVDSALNIDLKSYVIFTIAYFIKGKSKNNLYILEQSKTTTEISLIFINSSYLFPIIFQYHVLT